MEIYIAKFFSSLHCLIIDSHGILGGLLSVLLLHLLGIGYWILVEMIQPDRATSFRRLLLTD